MGFGVNGFVERLAELLAEFERTNVIEAAARDPAVAELRLARARNAETGRLDKVAPGVIAAVLHAIEDQVEVAPLGGFAAEIDVVRIAARGEVLKEVREVKTAADGVVIAEPEHVSVGGAVADIRREIRSCAVLFSATC